VGLITQVTDWLLLFATVAFSCCVRPAFSVALVGVKLSDIGGNSAGTNIVAEADCVASAWLVAIIVTDCCAAALGGAVYSPEELIEPTPAGLIVHVTSVLFVLFTLAVNC
jgi:hypothetical protein